MKKKSSLGAWRDNHDIHVRGDAEHRVGGVSIGETLEAAMAAAEEEDVLDTPLHAYSGRLPFRLASTLIAAWHPPQQRLLDPFCGSGTVPLASMMQGMECGGSDLHPLACMVAQTQCADVSATQARMFAGMVEAIVEASLERVRMRDKVAPCVPRAEWRFFPPHVLLELSGLRAEIDAAVARVACDAQREVGHRGDQASRPDGSRHPVSSEAQHASARARASAGARRGASASATAFNRASPGGGYAAHEEGPWRKPEGLEGAWRRNVAQLPAEAAQLGLWLDVMFSAIIVKFAAPERVEDRKRIRKGLVTEFWGRKAQVFLAHWAHVQRHARRVDAARGGQEGARASLPRQEALVHPMWWREDMRSLPEAMRRAGAARGMSATHHQRFDMICTSPPYGGTYDYHDQHRRRYPWIGLRTEDMLAGEIGARRHVSGTAPHASRVAAQARARASGENRASREPRDRRGGGPRESRAALPWGAAAGAASGSVIDPQARWRDEVSSMLRSCDALLSEGGLLCLVVGDARVGGRSSDAVDDLRSALDGMSRGRGGASLGLRCMASISASRLDWVTRRMMGARAEAMDPSRGPARGLGREGEGASAGGGGRDRRLAVDGPTRREHLVVFRKER